MPSPPIVPVQPVAVEKSAPGASSDATRTIPNTSATPSIKSLEGITSIDDKVFLECELLTYTAVSRMAKRIAEEIRESGIAPIGSTVILADETSLSAFNFYQSLLLQIRLLRDGFNSILHIAVSKLATVLPAIATGTATVKAVVDLLGLFRQDVSFFGRSTIVKNNAFAFELARFLEPDYEVSYPRVLLYKPSIEEQASQKKMAEKFDEVFAAREGATVRLQPVVIEAAKLDSELSNKEKALQDETDASQKSQLQQEVNDLRQRVVRARKLLDPALALFENFDKQLSTLMDGLNRPDEKNGFVPLQMAQRASEIAELLADNGFVLYAEVASAGGTYRVRKNLWRTLFCGDGLEFSGGAIACYGLFDTDARLLRSGTHRELIPFRRFARQNAQPAEFNTQFEIIKDTPVLKGLNPGSAAQGGQSFLLTIYGTGFQKNTVVKWANAKRAATFMTNEKLTIQVTAADIANAGEFGISVKNPDSKRFSNKLLFIVE